MSKALFAGLTAPPQYKHQQDFSREFTYALMLPTDDACHILRRREVFAFTEGQDNAKLIVDALNAWVERG